MDYVEKHFNKIILIFLYLQPVIDVLTSISINILEHKISFGMISRISFLIFMFFYYVSNKKVKNKKKVNYALFSIVIYLVLFIGNIIYVKDASVLMYEMQNTFRTFYFLFLLLLINNTLKEKIKVKHFINILLMYMLLIIIPVLTNTSFDAYTQGKIGEVGWFNSANEISGIFSILFPFLFKYIIDMKNKPFKAIVSILTIYAFTVLGTKMTVITILLTIFVYFVLYISKQIKSKKYKEVGVLSFVLILLFSTALFIAPKTNVYKNVEIHLNYLEINNVKEIFTKKNFDHFVFSSRLSFYDETKSNFKDASINGKLLGIGYIEKYGTDDINLKLIEMDFFDILFRHGIVGFLIYMYIFLMFVYQTLKVSSINYKLSLFLILFISTLVGHVLVSPAVSIYVIMILTNKIEESYEK